MLNSTKFEALKFRTKGTFVFNCETIAFFTLQNNQIFTMWKIPKSYCQSTILLHAENRLDAILENEIQNFPICYFTQLDGKHFSVQISQKFDRNYSLSFYNKDISRPLLCQSPINCEYQSTQPFFIRFAGERDEHNFKINLAYQIVSRPVQKDSNCGFTNIPLVSDSGVSMVPLKMIDISIVCTNWASGMINKFIWLIATILLTVLVLFVIHCIGAIKSFNINPYEEEICESTGYQQTELSDYPGSLLE